MTLYAEPIPHQKVQGAVMVRTDVYPANVSFSFGENPYSRTRAILTADKVIVLVEGGGSGASVLYEGRLEDLTLGQKEVTATTADGDVVITRQGGCGCGSSLRSYRPFSRVLRVATS